jgi:hypothetical protein
MTKAENIISLHDHRIKANEDQSDRLERRLDKIEKQLLSIKHTIYGAAGILIRSGCLDLGSGSSTKILNTNLTVKPT